MTLATAIPAAVAAVLAMAAMASPSAAAFLYVPPEKSSATPVAGSGSSRTAAGRPAVRGDEVVAGVPACGVPVPPLQLQTGTADGGSAERARVTPEEAAAESGLWGIRAGETLRTVLDRWGRRAGIEVLFLTDRRYRLHEGRAFNGSFGEATHALSGALSHLPHPPVMELRAGGGTLAVLHRTRPAEDLQAGDPRAGDPRAGDLQARDLQARDPQAGDGQ